MKGYRFYADLLGTVETPDDCAQERTVFHKRATRKHLKLAAERQEHCNVIALFDGEEHRRHDGMLEAVVAVYGHANSAVAVGSIDRGYLRGCRRIDEALARKLHPNLFAYL